MSKNFKEKAKKVADKAPPKKDFSDKMKKDIIEHPKFDKFKKGK